MRFTIFNGKSVLMITFLLQLLLHSCENQIKTDDYVVSIESMGCSNNKCPIYFLELKGRELRFNGIKNVDNKGRFQTTLDLQEVFKIQQKVSSIVVSYKNNEHGDVAIFDDLTIRMVIKSKGKEIRVNTYRTLLPREFKDLNKLLVEICNSNELDVDNDRSEFIVEKMNFDSLKLFTPIKK